MIRGLSGPKPPVHCSPNSLKCLDATNRLDDWFVQIQPSLMLGIGDVANQETFLMVNYLPNFFRYDDHPEFDSNQHIVRVLGGYKTGNLTLRLSQDVAILNNIVLAATSGERLSLVPSGRTDLDIYNTGLSANYNMTPRDFIFTELRMAMTEYAQPLVSSELYIADIYLNHGSAKVSSSVLASKGTRTR